MMKTPELTLFRSANQRTTYLLHGDFTTNPLIESAPTDWELLPDRLPQSHLPIELVVAHINDLHGGIAQRNKSGFQPNFAYIAGRLQQLRHQSVQAEHSAVLILAAGDDIGGSEFDELLFPLYSTEFTHPAYSVYAAAGLDAAGLGNHDFDFGVTVLARALRKHASFPVLCANLTPQPELAGLIHPAAIIVVEGLRVGLTSVLTQAQIKARPGHAPNLVPPQQALDNLLPLLRANCDVVILLSHLGHSSEASTAVVTPYGDRELAARLPTGSLDLIVGGHTHQFLNPVGLEPLNLVNDIPIVQAGWRGQALGEVRLRIDNTVTATDVRVTPITELPVDEVFSRQVIQPIVDQLKPVLERPLGRWQLARHQLPESSWDIGCGESNLANFVTDTLFSRCRLQGYPLDLAMIDTAFLQCRYPVNGSLNYGQLLELLPYNDPLYLYRLSGSQLLALLQDNARRLNQPGEAQMQRGFLHFSAGLRYQLVQQTPSRQMTVQNVLLNGRSLAAYHKTFLIACPAFTRQAALPWESWIRRTNGYQPFSLHSLPFSSTHLYCRSEILEQLMFTQGISAEAGARLDGRLWIEKRAGSPRLLAPNAATNLPSQMEAAL